MGIKLHHRKQDRGIKDHDLEVCEPQHSTHRSCRTVVHRQSRSISKGSVQPSRFQLIEEADSNDTASVGPYHGTDK